jgi:hypothetical protein
MAKRKKSRPPIAPFKSVEVSYVTIRDEEFEQLLDEWAEIVYCHLCQLSEKKTLVTETFTPHMAERTGTDGSKK